VYVCIDDDDNDDDNDDDVSRSTYHAILRGQHDGLLRVAFKQRPTESEVSGTLVTDDRFQLTMITNEDHVTST